MTFDVPILKNQPLLDSPQNWNNKSALLTPLKKKGTYFVFKEIV